LQNGKIDGYRREDGLPHDYVDALYEDREGSLWIGTRGGGLARLRDGKFSNFTVKEGLSHNFAKCVLEDREGALWIGSHGGGLTRYKNGQFSKFITSDGLISPFVWSIAEDKKGDIWIGTSRPASLSVFKEGRFTSFRRREGLPVERGVRAIFARIIFSHHFLHTSNSKMDPRSSNCKIRLTLINLQTTTYSFSTILILILSKNRTNS
jgi:sugar lactone lactonase YvrE